MENIFHFLNHLGKLFQMMEGKIKEWWLEVKILIIMERNLIK